VQKFYITTAIDYVNAPPHLGHAYEKIATDVISRHFKQRGIRTFFLTGTDEHGIKIQRTAEEKNIQPLEFCDEIASKFKLAWEILNVKYDRFIRTTEKDHEKVVQHIFKTLLEKGDIYKAQYRGLYCNGCESFVNERDLSEEGFCPNHNAKPQEVFEENYFFKLTKYKELIKNLILSNPRFIMPDFRATEVLNQLENVEDISVSRSKDSVYWGIPVPGDDSQIIYVWIDALSNYLTGIGYLNNPELYKNFWPANFHMIGKDILKFHSIYWISLLMAMEIPLPETIYGHGWITIDQTKMSKSLGNVISPLVIMEQFNLENSDPLRYFLMTTTPFGKDGNYSDEDFKNKVNADLANNLGNLLNRSLSMLLKYFDGIIIPEALPNVENNELAEAVEETGKIIIEKFDNYAISEAAEAIINLVNKANKYVNEQKPWSLAKNEADIIKCAQVLYNVLETMRHVSVFIYPFTPDISQKIWGQLSLCGNVSDVLLSELEWGGLKQGKTALPENVKPVFLRLESELAGDKKKK
jgi:methionyl-tRNA synthetase